MIIRPLNQFNRGTAIRLLKSHPETFGKMKEKRDIIHLLASQMWECDNDKGDFVGMFGLNRFYKQDSEFEEIVFCNCYVLKKYRRKGIFNKMIEFAKEQAHKDEIEIHKLVYLTINCEKRNKLAYEIYNNKFKFHRYSKKDKIYWWEIELN